MAMIINKTNTNDNNILEGGFKLYTPREFVKIALCKYVNPTLEKESYDVILREMEGFKLNWLNEPETTLEMQEFLNLMYMYIEIEKGFTARELPADQHISGLSDQSIWLKDAQGISKLGIVDNTRHDIYKLLYKSFMRIAEKLGFKSVLNMSRKEFKKIVIPLFYNGEHKLYETLEKEEAKKFLEIYKHFFPLAEGFRHACLNCWNETSKYDYWMLPDGYEVKCTHRSTSEVLGFEWNGYKFYGKCKQVKALPKMTRTERSEYRTPGTRSLAANITHSVDAWIQREVKYRCAMTRARACYILNECRGFNPNYTEDKKLTAVIDKTVETGITSARLFWMLEKNPHRLPEHIKDNLREIIKELPTEAFCPVSVHDEFSVHPKYMNALRWEFNCILTQLYKGWIQHYFNKQLNMNVKVGVSDDATANAIKNWNYGLVL